MILIDGDILVYQAAAYWEDVFKWEEADEEADVIPHIEEAWHLITDRVASHCATLEETKDVLIVFSAPTCFRHDLMPEYKANRKGKRRPSTLKELTTRTKEYYQCVAWANLEADDVLGILCTRNPEAIVVTIDKDQAVVPGRWYNPNRPEWGIRVITEKEANRNHLIQTMTGDSSDGYKGAPRVGPKGAERIMAHCEVMFLDPWLEVVDAFLGKGLTADDALLNARMAYILRDGDYIKKTGEVKLWTPKIVKHCGSVSGT